MKIEQLQLQMESEVNLMETHIQQIHDCVNLYIFLLQPVLQKLLELQKNNQNCKIKQETQDLTTSCFGKPEKVVSC